MGSFCHGAEQANTKPIRLKDYDYAQNGTYFATVCTYKRRLAARAAFLIP